MDLVVCWAQQARWMVFVSARVLLYVVPLLIHTVRDEPSLLLVPWIAGCRTISSSQNLKY
jgi:hypothetical protein